MGEEKIMEELLHAELTRIIAIKENDYILRYGKLFSTEFNNYFYDTGTGKVAILDDKDFRLLSALFSKDNDSRNFMKIFSDLSLEKKNSFLETLIKENLLRAYKVTTLNPVLAGTSLENELNNNIRQLVLEVTEKCNFRCKYCIYNEDYKSNRSFGTDDMDFNTAKKAIDYIMLHSREKVAVTFYGGEPLLNFELIKKSIEYALEKGKDKALNFSITSNLSIINEEIANYLANIPNLAFLASIDGPENIQNTTRVYSGGKSTFNDTMRGLRFIAEAFKKTGNVLMINAVFVPPYDYEKIEKINDFFEHLDFLPENIQIQITYPELDSYQYSEWEDINNNEKYVFDGRTIDPLKKWALFKAKKNGLTLEHTKNIYFHPMYSYLQQVEMRYRSDKPSSFHYFNGCCIPGARKIYVKTNGDILLCERIGTSPKIGNIHTGIDVEVVKKKYIDEYIEASIPDCSKCWGIRMCGNCYCNCYSEKGIELQEKRKYCEGLLEDCHNRLVVYYTLKEEYPEILDIFKESTYTLV